MVVANNKIEATKNAGKSTTISMTMRMRQCDLWGASPDEVHPGLHFKPLDAAIGRVLALNRRGGRHGRRLRSKTKKTLTKNLFFAS
jgi:hypothetical protein